MTKKSIADTSAELYKLLEAFSSEERERIVRGTLTLFGDSGVELSNDGGSTSSGSSGFKVNSKDAKAFFDQKAPNSKIEELAVAARFRELTSQAERHTKEQFKEVATGARRNFDNNNFARDINNARNSGLFNKGGSIKEGFTLSYYGQNYVDVLPDREKLR
ncbi:MAG: hypothetical protein ACYC1T_09230 [Sulfuricaulis sp.]